MDTQEMEVALLAWLFDYPCCLSRSLKETSKILAICGIILSIIFLLFGAAGNFLIFYLSPHEFYGVSDDKVALISGVVALVEGIVLLTYNAFLLNSVKKNKAAEVKKAIRLGCFILLYVQLIKQLLIFAAIPILLVYFDSFSFELGMLISELLFDLLGILLTMLVLYGVHMVKPDIVTIYVYILFFLMIFYAVFFGFQLGFWHYLLVSILKWLLTLLWMSYCLHLLALHRRMMTPLPPQLHHQLRHFDGTSLE